MNDFFLGNCSRPEVLWGSSDFLVISVTFTCFFLHNLIISVKHNCNAHLRHRFFWWDPLFQSAQLNGRGCLTPPVFQEMKQVRRTSWQHGASENSVYKTMPEFPLNSILLITKLYIYTMQSLDISIILIQRGQVTFGSSMVTVTIFAFCFLKKLCLFHSLQNSHVPQDFLAAGW